MQGRRCADAAGALENHHTLELRRQRGSRCHAVCLNFLSAKAQQACRFQRMRREYRPLLPARPLAQQRLQTGIGSHGIQAIRVNDQSRTLIQQGRQKIGDDGSAAATTGRRGRGERKVLERSYIRQRTRHQFRPCVACIRCKMADVNPSGAHMQGRASGQPGGACHAGGTAHNADIAEAALVAGVRWRAFRQARHCLEVRTLKPCGSAGSVRRRGGCGAEPVKPDLPAGIPAMGGEQAGLERQQRHRMVGMDALRSTGAFQPVSRFRMQPGRNIHRQGLARDLLHGRDAGLHGSGGSAAGANPEQGVDAQVVCEQRGRPVNKADARRHRICVRCAGIGGQGFWLLQQGRQHLLALCLQPGAGLQPVAPVVPRPAGNPDRLRMRCHGQRHARHGQAGALHQRMCRQQRHVMLLHPPGGRNVMQGQGVAVRRQMQACRRGRGKGGAGHDYPSVYGRAIIFRLCTWRPAMVRGANRKSADPGVARRQ